MPEQRLQVIEASKTDNNSKRNPLPSLVALEVRFLPRATSSYKVASKARA